MSDIRAGTALAMIALGCLAMAPFQFVMMRIGPRRWADRLPTLLSRLVARIVGVRVAVRGRASAGVTLFVANHISYLDIPILSGRAGAAFIAKKEVAGWGGLGMMAKLYRSVFVDRARRYSSATQRDEILSRLEAGDSLILFAEGTSTDGTAVKPFKSALFSVAQALPDLVVQPVTVAYTHLNGMPLTRSQRPLIGWYGDMEMPSHVWRLLGLGRIDAVVQFHAPWTMRQAGSRKELATRCRDAVARGLAAANSGRLD